MTTLDVRPPLPGAALPPPPRRVSRAASLLGAVRARAGMSVLWAVLVAFLILPTLSFLVLAVSPHLFGQGAAWFTTSNVTAAMSGVTLHGMIDSVTVSVFAAVVATSIGLGLAWVVQRSDLPGRRFWSIGLWAILIIPTYVIGVGWEEVLGPTGLLRAAGVPDAGLSHLFFSGFGVAVVLAFRGVPFAYFATSGALAGLGRDLEDAVRVHGGSKLDAARVVVAVLAPALFASLVIVFAESIGDFGVAATIAVASNFPVATYQIYTSISTFPAQFGIAAVIGCLLVVAVGGALAVQARSTRGRSYAVLGGRTRPARTRELDRRAKLLTGGAVWAFFALALGVPVLGGITSSFFPPLASLTVSNLTFSYYAQILRSAALGGSILFSLRMALVAGTAAVIVAAVVARLISSPRVGKAGRLLDLTLLAAVAVPGIVFAAGYIFTYNLRFWGHLGLDLYGTSLLLGIAYAAVALPTSTRVLTGPMAQIQGSLLAAGRVHGANASTAWRRGALPLVARSLMWAWLLAFSGTFLELPVSEMLSPAGVIPVSVAITQMLNKSNLVQGAALSVAAVVLTLAIIGLVLGTWRVLAPQGWKRLGERLS